MPSLTHLEEMHDSKEKHVTLQVNLQHITYQLGQDEDHLHYQPLIYATLHLFKIPNKNSNPYLAWCLKPGVISLGYLSASSCVKSKSTSNSNQMCTFLLLY